ncbi:hypothetical protein BaRGS_00022366 [Batillaria attramentaria]|uniref:C-type lectin domain-containing protein n=1 Tax=Batillaria attramentaria TaxID=370345 RepID=A0ABD0KHP4_9CAEN
MCPPKWNATQQFCYIFIAHSYTWSAASATCAALNARLPEVPSETENNFIANMLRTHGAHSGWLGMEDFATEGEFVWATSQELPEYTNWNSGEPNALVVGDEDEDCVEMIASSGKWNDERCEHSIHRFSVICQKE